MFSLQGKVALVTGASRGLGWAMAQALARQGAQVILNARDPAALEQCVAKLSAQGGRGEAAAFDSEGKGLFRSRAGVAGGSELAAACDLVYAAAGDARRRIFHQRALTIHNKHDTR